MKEKRRKENTKALEAHWEKVAALYEDPKSSKEMLEKSRALTTSERRRFLGKSKTRAISIRIPEDDLLELKKIAQRNDRKYQQLIVVAIEQYLEQLHHQKVG